MVVDVRTNWECRTIDAKVAHESFDRVEPGWEIPVHGQFGCFQVRRIVKQRNEEQTLRD